jgi:hypothetical protein
MIVESKPCFHPKVVRQQVRAFNLSEHVRACQPGFGHCVSLIASGRAGEFNETPVLPDVLTDIRPSRNGRPLHVVHGAPFRKGLSAAKKRGQNLAYH